MLIVEGIMIIKASKDRKNFLFIDNLLKIWTMKTDIKIGKKITIGRIYCEDKILRLPINR